MLPGEEKIKDFFEEKTEAIANKIERTPMEKFFVFFLVLITVASVGLGYMQFKQNLESPFALERRKIVRADIKEKYNINALTANTNLSDTESLKTKDSDLDGLDDYTEINIYGTNPYLEDSDNDSLWDKQEIINGTNPNCAEGTVCSISSSQQSSFQSDLPTLDELVPPIPSFNENINSGDYSNLMNINQSLTDYNSGLPSGELQSLLNQLQGQTLTEEQKAEGLAMLKNLTPAEIRQQLISSGFDASLLDQIDDETLQRTFLDLISAYTTGQ